MLAYIPYMDPIGNRSIDRDTDKIYIIYDVLMY